VSQDNVYIGYVCALASISEERGLEHVQTYNCAVNTQIFIEYLRHLSILMKGVPFVIFMDNLAVHKSGETRAAMTELKIKYIFNVPYSPQYNPIERGFSVVKNHYKRARLNAMRNGATFIVQRAIHQAFK